MGGNYIKRAIKDYSVTRQLEYAIERYKRKKIYLLDCEKEAERIVKELDLATQKTP